MKAIIITLIMMIMVSSLAFATVVRSGGGSSLTYSTSLTSTYPKAYWAVQDTIGAGCVITGASCSGTNMDCSYTSGTIRVVGYTSETGGNMPTSITVSLSGSGSCTMNNGFYVEAYNTGTQAVTGTSTTITAQSVSMNLGGTTSCTNSADTNSDCTLTLSEVIAYAEQWVAQSGPTLSQVISAAEIWVAGGSY